MTKLLYLLLPVVLSTASLAQTYYRGGDLSFVNELEACGVVWKQNNVEKDIFSIFKNYGANIARFRIWHSPSNTVSSSQSDDQLTNGQSDYFTTEALISRAKAAGFKVILDFHYSDTWTDPEHQKCPAAWNSVVNNSTLLADSLYTYTKSVLSRLKSKNLSPDFIQVGNETNGGMCFGGDGIVTWPTDWSNQKKLYNAGIRAVREVVPNSKIILHVADPQHAEWWAGELKKNGVSDFDIIGISYYPIIHTTKSINDIGTIIGNIKKNFNKEVMIVETGVPWTNKWDDTTTNMMNGVPLGYGNSESPEIQAKWLKDLSSKVQTSGGLGVVYWAPEWVASHSPGCVKDFGGSTWENMTFFDFNSNLMNNGGIQFIGTPTPIIINKSKEKKLQFSISIHKNRLYLHANTDNQSEIQIEIYTLQGEKKFSFVASNISTNNMLEIVPSDIITESGMYIVKIQSDNCFYVMKVNKIKEL